MRYAASVILLTLFALPLRARIESAGCWLNVPFVRQARNACGAACISMVMQYWQRQLGAGRSPASNPARIMRELYSPSAHGIYADAMSRYFHQSGFAAYAFRGSWRALAHHLARGRPLIVALGPTRGSGPLHYVVVAGIDPAENVVLVNDPARRKLLKMDWPRLEKRWKATDYWTLLALPH